MGTLERATAEKRHGEEVTETETRPAIVTALLNAAYQNEPDSPRRVILLRAARASEEMHKALERIVALKDEAYEIEPVSREVADIVARNAGRIAKEALRRADGRE